jgi:hypothetical protein
MFRLTPPGAGIKLLAPIDIALIWGSTDTLSNGSYRTPLDTALSFTGARTVSVPFRAWNLTDRQKVDLLVVESSGRTNQRWDPGDRIIFLTPPPYRTLGNNTHAEFSSSEFSPGVRLPGVGDTLYVFTKRPLTTQDRYTFTTSRSFIVNAERPSAIPYSFSLLQNFPNPFNPSTAIRYSIPARGRTVLTLWNVMGQQVRVIVDQIEDPGEHRVNFKSGDLASGVYFYTLQFGEMMIARKMVLLK